jgi:Uma2 family endonuclease
MATATLTPVEAYLAKTWSPDREYIDGEVCERNLGEFPHSDLQSAIVTWLRNRRRKWNVRVVVEQRVQVSPGRFRIPDVSVLSAEGAVDRIISNPPLICIEVLSREDTIKGYRERIADYVAMGVPNIWLFDPERREVWICTNDAMTKVTSDVLGAPGTDIAIPLAEIWADLD